MRHKDLSCIQMDLYGVIFLDSVGIKALVLCQADAHEVDCQMSSPTLTPWCSPDCWNTRPDKPHSRRTVHSE